jgi:hypothetical protein
MTSHNLQCLALYIAHTLENPAPADEATAEGERLAISKIANDLANNLASDMRTPVHFKNCQ